jgi:hypothetical protein
MNESVFRHFQDETPGNCGPLDPEPALRTRLLVQSVVELSRLGGTGLSERGPERSNAPSLQSLLSLWPQSGWEASYSRLGALEGEKRHVSILAISKRRSVQIVDAD